MTFKRIGPWALIAALASLGTAGPACAHHALSMYDASKRLTLEGVVKSFRFTNPHVELELTVTDAEGRAVDWMLEGSSPAQLQRRGWRRTSLQVGETVTVTGVYPLRSGQPGGTMGAVTRSDGVTIGVPRPGL
jgi:hypothetical protein